MNPKGNIGIGLDISGNLISVLQLERHGKGIRVLSARSMFIPPDLPSKEERDAALREGVGRMLEGMEVRKAILVAGLGGQIAFVRKMKLPPVPKGKIKQIVSYEVQQQIPFPLKEVVWDYHLSTIIKKKTTSVEVIMAAVKGEMVENMVEQVRQGAGKEPDVVDISVIALHNALSYNELLTPDSTGIVVSVGWNFTDIIIEEGGTLAFTRSIPIGERNMLREIMKEQGEGYNEAMGMLFSGESKVVESVWQDLFTEIKRTMNYYLSQVEKVASFDEIVVHGRISRSPQFLKFLSSYFPGNIRRVDPWAKIPKPAGVDDGYYGTTLGLALRPLLDSPLEVNLLPPRVVRKKVMEKKKPYFFLSGILIPFVAATLSAFSYQDYTITQLKLERVEKAVKSFEPYIPKIKELYAKRREIEGKLREIESVLSQKTFWSDFLREISLLTPSDIYITKIARGEASEMEKPARGNRNVEYGAVMLEPTQPTEGYGRRRRREPVAKREIKKGNSFLISGRTKSFPRVDEYISRLQDSPLMEEVTLVNVAREGEEVAFLLQVKVKGKEQ
ncbi:MAG: pilus assembly protein PilM [Caldiserica bacterium]|nr:pilus assembly protein PilM [Caldisericota bacterium]